MIATVAAALDATNASEPRRNTAFTLIETLAAVLLTALIITVALGLYVNVSQKAEAATQRLRDDLHALTILDRIASDVESATLLVKPEEMDPLSHPWYFIAESQQSFDGADAIRFISRKPRSYVSTEHTSDFAQIAYQLEEDEAGTYSLYRWLRPGLPTDLDMDFPSLDDERNHLLGEQLSGFRMLFLDEEGEWIDSWDSTQLVQSSTLPAAIQIMFDLGVANEESDEFGEPEEPAYTRKVVLNLPPIDLAGMILAARGEDVDGLDGDDGGGDEDGEGGTSQSQMECLRSLCQSQTGEVAALCGQLDGPLATPQLISQIAAQVGCP